ncbi:uroporphyrinogen-III synthase [Granulicella arctica]|uniref:uroporphyrinogen-III synthase n=1 Tax=Granulicella arctica TaxID=940613 RepID=UPI0021DF4AB8|nr:uroporphyrinogen-III synthase [Granulicella arctica]
MPLIGKRILITRTRHQASELAAQLESAGAETISIPTIELAAPLSYCVLDASLASLRSFEWVIFTSINAVHAFAARAKTLSIMPSPRKIAVIGPATARAVREIGLIVDLMPKQYVAESLAEALVPFASSGAMLLIRAEEARDVLPDALHSAGAQLTIASAYRNIVPTESIAALQKLLAHPESMPDAITFTSSSTATNLFALLEQAALTLPKTIVRASIGPVTSQTLRELGYPPDIQAKEPTIASLCSALTTHWR